MSETIAAIPDLLRVKHLSGLEAVTVRAGSLKRRGLLRHGLKYALWALAPGGRLIVVDDGPVTTNFEPLQMPWNRVKQQIFKVLGRETELEAVDEAALTVTLRRTRPEVKTSWSAGIVFSGDIKELPALERAVDGLRAQPELSLEAGGQIMVCGPSEAKGILKHLPGIEYIEYNKSHLRPPIPQKKNALIAAAQSQRIVIQHARIVLQSGCLSALPREFDLITPRVEYRERDAVVPYLDWVVTDALDGQLLPRRQPPRNDYDRSRYLELMRLGLPFLDGALFMIDREAALEIPLNEHVAWGEAEDMEWCARFHAAGRLIDLEPNALAISQTFKWSRLMIEKPRLYEIGRKAMRAKRRLLGMFG